MLEKKKPIKTDKDTQRKAKKRANQERNKTKVILQINLLQKDTQYRIKQACMWFWYNQRIFGKGTRGYIAASPNKSIVGFIGGILSSITAAILFKVLFPNIITTSYGNLAIIGFFTSLAAIVGDLIESVFKRSCNIKDSGNIIPGRGGVLDSIDSILIAAPIFYICYHFLF